ncbi:MAG: glutathione S-transferase family protein [Cytophagales bacterium]|nr:glutathione S-transferase family protein [Cytophagales bacterium]
MRLFIGNKNYSSWSMRPWVLLKQAGIAFEEVKILFDSFKPDSHFKQSIKAVSALGKVPVLVDGDLTIYESLAIVEYLAESFPDKHLWPADKVARAKARMACAEMHVGFTALRSACPMNIEASLPHIGAIVMRDNGAAVANVKRLETLWGELLRQYAHTHSDGMLFGAFCAADAYFAPVVMRLKTYGIAMSPMVTAYMSRLCAMPGVATWITDALAEHEFRDFEEPYRLSQ